MGKNLRNKETNNYLRNFSQHIDNSDSLVPKFIIHFTPFNQSISLWSETISKLNFYVFSFLWIFLITNHDFKIGIFLFVIN